MRRKLLIFVAGALVVIVALVFLIQFDYFTPGAPTSWAQVQPGMSRDHVLHLIGAPQQSGWPEDTEEIWQISGTICNRRLLIFYKTEAQGVGNVEVLWDETWLRDFGELHSRMRPK